MVDPLVSVIIPIYNRAQTLVETLNSLIGQTLKNWEGILVDDGSTDGSISIITNYLGRDKRFSFYQRNRAPKGAPTCRNIGLEKAKGKYILFLDSDDLLADFCLDVRCQCMEEGSLHLGVFNTYEFIDSPDKIIGMFNKHPTKAGETYLDLFLQYALPWQTMGAIWHADFIKSLGGFDEGFPRLQDIELHVRALLVPNINFKVFKDLPADCFYRKATVYHSGFNFSTEQTLGVQMYLERLSLEVEQRTLSYAEVKQLRLGVLFLIHRYFNNTNVYAWEVSLHKILFLMGEKAKVLSPKDIILIKIYTFLWRKNSAIIKRTKSIGFLARILFYDLRYRSFV